MTLRATSAALALAFASMLPGIAHAATIVGRVASPSVVWVTDGSTLAPVQSEMRNVEKMFVPEFLVVPVNSTVRFPNDAPFFHSIYSASESDPFDLGYYLTGPGKDVVFANAGAVAVRCHIHVTMHATIVVVDGPFVKADGAYTIENVRPGEHVLHIVAIESGDTQTRTVRVPKSGTLTLTER